MPYLLYFKVVRLYLNYFFYARQKAVVSLGVPFPVLGHVPHLLWYRNFQNNHMFVNFVDAVYKRRRETVCKKTNIIFVNEEPSLLINDVNVVEQLYTTYNAYFDKHPEVQNAMWRLTGKSILFDETNTEWKNRRKAISPAFYKGKL